MGPSQLPAVHAPAELATISASGNADMMEPFHAIPNDLLSGPLAEGPSDPLLREEPDAAAAADPLGGLFGTSDARFPFSSALGATADPLTCNSTAYAPAFTTQLTQTVTAHAFDAPGPLLSSLHTPSASGTGSGSFARTLPPGSPLSPGLLHHGHTDSLQMAPGPQGSRHFLPLGSASYGPSTTGAPTAADITAQRGGSLGGPAQSLADDLWPRRHAVTADATGLGSGLDWNTSLPGITRRTSRLGPGVLQEAFTGMGCPSSPRSQSTYAGVEGLYTSDRGVGLLPGDAAAVWGRSQEKLGADGSCVLQGDDLAGRWPDELRCTIGADPGGLWVFAPPGGATADSTEHDGTAGLGAAAARMHAAAAATAPTVGLAGLDRTAGQGLFAFGAPGASVFGAGGSSWSALPDPAPADQPDEGTRLGLLDMPSFMQRDLPYGGQAVAGGVDAGAAVTGAGGGVPQVVPQGVPGVSGAVDMVMQDSVRSGAGSQWSEGSQPQRKASEFNVHAAEFQVRRPRMSSKELFLPHDLIE